MKKPLNPNAQLWVDALRSGEYKQLEERLGKTDGNTSNHCCLGVLCEVAIKEGLDINKSILPSGEILYDWMTGILPESVMNWVGLSHDQGRTDSGASLAGFNDTGSSFSKIADIIESQPEGLFR